MTSSAAMTGSQPQFAAAGVPDIKEQLLKGYKTTAMTYKVHLDGYNQLDFLTGKLRKTRVKSSSTGVTMAIC